MRALKVRVPLNNQPAGYRCLSIINSPQSGVNYALGAANAITPHLAGAMDILVVEQPDGSLLSTPFFGMTFCFT